MRGQLRLLVLIASITAFAQAFPAFAQDECGEFFEGLFEAKGRISSRFWESKEVQSTRLEAALDGDLSESSPRIVQLIEAQIEMRRANAQAWEKSDIRAAMKKLGTESPQVIRLEHRVIYLNRATGEMIFDDPLCGCFWFEKISNADHPGFGDWHQVWASGEKVYDYRSFSSHQLGDAQTHEAISRAMALAYARIANKSGLILQRLWEHGDQKWETRSRDEAIRRFLGSDYRVIQDGYKVRLINERNGVTIIDDPYGEYFRVMVSIGRREAFVDGSGKRNGDRQATHFLYSNHTGELAVELSRIPRSPKPQGASIPSRPSAPPELDLARVRLELSTSPQRSATNGESRIDEQVRIALDIRNHPRDRAEALHGLKWDDLSPEARELLLLRASTLVVKAGPRQILSDTSEIREYIELAHRSRDWAWIPLLLHWKTQWEGIRQGWQSYRRAEARDALKDLEKLALEQMPQSPFARVIVALYHSNAGYRAAALKLMKWEELDGVERKELVDRAEHLVVTGNDPVLLQPGEIQAYIELANRSQDPIWIPLLERWTKDWATAARRGWQGGARSMANEVLRSLQSPESGSRDTRG